MNYNKTLIGGNLTRDPELRYTQNGNAVVNLGIAVNRNFKDKAGNKQEETTFVDAEAWGKTAEVIGQHFVKGQPIFIEGRLKANEWEDKQGNRRTKLLVVVESFSFVGSAKSRENASEPDFGAMRGVVESSVTPAGVQDDDDVPF